MMVSLFLFLFLIVLRLVIVFTLKTDSHLYTVALLTLCFDLGGLWVVVFIFLVEEYLAHNTMIE